MSGDLIPPDEEPPESDGKETPRKPLRPSTRIEDLWEKVQLMAMQQPGANFDLGSLTDAQKDKLMQVVEKNEEHAFQYYQTEQRNKRDIKLAEINASTFNFKTNRISLIIVLIIVFVITLVVLIWKDNYFLNWISFLTGLVGGYGVAKIPTKPRRVKSKEED